MVEIDDSNLILIMFFEERNHVFFIFVLPQSLLWYLTNKGFSVNAYNLIETLSLSSRAYVSMYYVAYSISKKYMKKKIYI